MPPVDVDTITAKRGPATDPPAAPYLAGRLVLRGERKVGAVLSCPRGVWLGEVPMAVTFQWRRGYAAIPGEVFDEYVLTAADVGQVVDCVATAINPVGTFEAPSEPAGEIPA